MSDVMTCEKALQIAERWKAEDDAAYNDWKGRHDIYQASVTKYDEWNSCKNNLDCRGQYAQYVNSINDLRNEKKTWNNCVAWNETQSGRHNDWCENDIAKGWRHTGQTGEGCWPGFGKGVCSRSDDKIKQELYLQPPTVTQDPGPQPNRRPLPKIDCCNSFVAQGLKASEINFDDINQSCGGVPEGKFVGKSSSNIFSEFFSNPSKFFTNSENTQTIIISIVISIFLFILSSSSLFIFISRK